MVVVTIFCSRINPPHLTANYSPVLPQRIGVPYSDLLLYIYRMSVDDLVDSGARLPCTDYRTIQAPHTNVPYIPEGIKLKICGASRLFPCVMTMVI